MITIISTTTTMIIITCVTWAKLSQDGLGPFFERTPLIARKVFSAGRSWRNGAEEPPWEVHELVDNVFDIDDVVDDQNLPAGPWRMLNLMFITMIYIVYELGVVFRRANHNGDVDDICR